MNYSVIVIWGNMAKSAKITIIVDNEPSSNLLSSWGFSAYIETNEWSVLFDADTDPRVMEYNTRQLGIDLHKVNFAILSHHHGDHYGGFKYIGSSIPGLNVYIPPGLADYLKKWGLNPITVSSSLKVFEDAWIIGPLEAWSGFYEIAFAFYVSGKGLIVVVGCSHPGVDRISMKAKEISNMEIYHVLGGYHSPSRSTLDKLSEISKFISPAHCSGRAAKEYVISRYPEKYIDIKTGLVLTY